MIKYYDVRTRVWPGDAHAITNHSIGGFQMYLEKSMKAAMTFVAAVLAGHVRMFKLKAAMMPLVASAVIVALAWPAAATPNLCQAPPADTAVSVINNINHPVGIVADHFRGVVYVADFTAATVSAIHESTNTIVATIPVGTLPYAMAIDTFHGKVYVTNYSSASVSVIDEKTNTVTATITGVDGSGHGIAVDPAAGRVYVVTVSGVLWVIDQESNTIINKLALPTAGGGVEVDPVRGTIYVSINGRGIPSIEVIDPNTLTVTATIPLTTPNTGWMAIDPVGRKLYVAGATTQEGVLGAVFVIDTATNKLTNTIPGIQNDIISVAFDPVSRTVYAAGVDYASYDGGVMVIDAVTNTLTDTIPLKYAFGLALDVVRRKLYVSLPNTDSVEVFSTGAPHSWPVILPGGHWRGAFN